MDQKCESMDKNMIQSVKFGGQDCLITDNFADIQLKNKAITFPHRVPDQKRRHRGIKFASQVEYEIPESELVRPERLTRVPFWGGFMQGYCQQAGPT